MGKIAFTTDKKKVNVGEYFTVSWECRNPDMVTLSVQDGGKTVYQLGDSGTKAINASGNADKIILVLRASIGGQVEEKTVSVRVKRKVIKAEKVSYSPRNRKMFSGFSGIKEKWTRIKSQYKTVWTHLPDTKKLALKVTGLLTIAISLSAISPKLLPWGLMAIVGYLGWIVVK